MPFERGIFYRKVIGKRATEKRQTLAPVFPRRRLAHLRRWMRHELTSFVEFNGKPVASVKRGFGSGVALAGSPTALRPTRSSCGAAYRCGTQPGS
jgi:hypothetical protein